MNKGKFVIPNILSDFLMYSFDNCFSLLSKCTNLDENE